MYDLLRAKAQGMRKEAIGLLRELVQIPSLSGEEAEVARSTERAFHKLGFDRVFTDEFGNVLGLLLGRESKPVVLLTSHLDTVSPGKLDVWSDSPWSGHIADGHLHGLGAVDCKGGVVTQAWAAALLRRALLPLEGSVVVAATVSEENGKSLGVRALLDHTLPSLDLVPTYAILGEPTNSGIYYGHDGWIQIEVGVRGANPFQVNDAATAIFDDLRETGAGAPLRPGIESFAIHEPRYADQGGLRSAAIDLERRLGPGDDAERVVGQIRHEAELAARGATAVALDVRPKQVARKLGALSTQVSCVVDAWSTDPFSPLVERARQALDAAGLESRPGKWNLGRLDSGTAGSTLVRRYGIPTIGYGPGDDALAHAPNERVNLERLEQAALGTAAIVHALCGVPVFGWTTDDP
jgi:acetylornithine deacetylase/succinyl-diaminopimelate desuccinylase-like protein